MKKRHNWEVHSVYVEIKTKDGRVMSLDPIYFGDKSFYLPKAKTYARLIAAAPQMLEALRRIAEIQQSCVEMPNGGNNLLMNKAWNDVEKAIAKAEGR